MKFTNDDERRALTRDEISAGIAWMESIGFRFVQLAPNAAYYIREDDHFTIQVNSPKSGWWVTVWKVAGERSRVVGEGHSFGECTTVQEAIEDARDAIEKGDGIREQLVQKAKRDMLSEVRHAIKHDRYVRKRQRERNRGRVV